MGFCACAQSVKIMHSSTLSPHLLGGKNCFPFAPARAWMRHSYYQHTGDTTIFNFQESLLQRARAGVSGVLHLHSRSEQHPQPLCRAAPASAWPRRMLHRQRAQQRHPATLGRAQLARSFPLLLLLAAALTPAHGQSASQHTYSAICVVAKDENRYLAEWVQYHKCLGEHRCLPATGNTATPVAWSRDLLLVQH